MAVPFNIPTSNVWEFQLVCIFVHTWHYQLLNFRNSNIHIVVAHHGFNLNLPSGYDVENFSLPYLPFVFLLWWSQNLTICWKSSNGYSPPNLLLNEENKTLCWATVLCCMKLNNHNQSYNLLFKLRFCVHIPTFSLLINGIAITASSKPEN